MEEKEEKKESGGKWDVLEVVKGAYLSKLVEFLYEKKIVKEMGEYTSARKLAEEKGYNEQVLLEILDFVSGFTDLVEKKAPKGDPLHKYDPLFRLNPKYSSYQSFGHHLDKFLGTYLPCFGDLEETLKKESLGSDFINKEKFSESFHSLPIDIGHKKNNPVALMISKMKRKCILDLGDSLSKELF